MNQAQKQAASERAKLVWAKRRAKAQGYSGAPAVGVTPRDRIVEAKQQEQDARAEEGKRLLGITPTGDRWRDLPIDEALHLLASMEKEIQHARQVMGDRTSQRNVINTCWTAIHRRESIPGMSAAYNQCHKDIPDGKEIFRDNCVVNPDTKLVDPVVVCSMLCYQLYMQHRARLKMKQREN